jgi:hypothetical protein
MHLLTQQEAQRSLVPGWLSRDLLVVQPCHSITPKAHQDPALPFNLLVFQFPLLQNRFTMYFGPSLWVKWGICLNHSEKDCVCDDRSTNGTYYCDMCVVVCPPALRTLLQCLPILISFQVQSRVTRKMALKITLVLGSCIWQEKNSNKTQKFSESNGKVY